ncbi:MAG: ATP-binding protein, partial [Pseudomonadota bacterium]|nr:ATP-binding protein [Pseudomonadota bacterium]
ADGHYVWLEAHFATRWNEDGELRDYIGVVRDIGGRRREKLLDTERNARIRENNRLLQMAEQIANVGHWRVDVQEDTLIWSDQVYRIHGVDSDFTPTVADGLEFYYEEDRERVSEMVGKAFEEGEDFSFQARIVRPDGELRHVTSVGHAETSPTGEVITVVGVFKDITETVVAQEQLRQSRDEAERASQAKAHFLANMSHEIRTPMNGVIGFADLLLESELAEEHHEYARMISDSGKAMLRLLNELLDLSKIEAGRMQLSREAVDYGHLVRSSVRLFEPNAKAKGIALDMEIADDLPEGVGDKLRVRQIILNLIGNAIKFTEEGSVRIRAREENGKIVIRVIDTGPGIAPDKLNYIFEEFTQLETSAPPGTVGSGTGLGLAIARQLAELMDGELS